VTTAYILIMHRVLEAILRMPR